LSQTPVEDRAGRTDQYGQIAEYYDLEHDGYTEDLPLIRHLVETVGDPVLELGCGTGRVLATLADTGMRLTGVDSSVAMLDRCRTRFAREQQPPTLVEAEMSSTPLPKGAFGIVILALNTLLHATTSLEQRAVLGEAFRLLDPRGLLFIDIANPHAGAFDFGDDVVVEEGHWRRGDGSTVAKFSSRQWLQVDQIVRTHVWYDNVDPQGVLRRASAKFDLRMIYPSELRLMLELAGYVEFQLYGSYELDPLTDTSARLIVMAEKTASG
jgi:ubiquinone/menaquinone biosynthesis C-methylase UbiE